MQKNPQVSIIYIIIHNIYWKINSKFGVMLLVQHRKFFHEHYNITTKLKILCTPFSNSFSDRIS